MEAGPMDIIEFLEKDHERLRRELSQVKNRLSQAGCREELKTYISFHELHESIEEEILFPRLVKASLEEPVYEDLFGLETEHTQIWSQLEELMDSLTGGRLFAPQN